MTSNHTSINRIKWTGRALVLSSAPVFLIGMDHPISAILILIGMYGIYLLQQTKWFGRLGLFMSAIGTFLLIALNVLAYIAAVLSVQLPFPKELGILIVVLVSTLGYIFLGIATVRSSDLPRLNGYLLILTPILVIILGILGTVAFTLGLLWIGRQMVRIDATSDKGEAQELEVSDTNQESHGA